MSTKKNAKKPAAKVAAKPSAKVAAKAARSDGATGRGQAPEPRKGTGAAKPEHRMLTAAEYLALEKYAKRLESALRIRRKFQFAVLNANALVEKNLGGILEIARGGAE